MCGLTLALARAPVHAVFALSRGTATGPLADGTQRRGLPQSAIASATLASIHAIGNDLLQAPGNSANRDVARATGRTGQLRIQLRTLSLVAATLGQNAPWVLKALLKESAERKRLPISSAFSLSIAVFGTNRPAEKPVANPIFGRGDARTECSLGLESARKTKGLGSRFHANQVSLI